MRMSGKQRIECLIEDRIEDGYGRGDEDDLKQRRADADIGRHAEEVDHRRHHDEPAADAEDRSEEPDDGADD